jgi:uncharacterized 2Fe-2S/4Fe-4S cluster protein (DUF4445 family)
MKGQHRVDFQPSGNRIEIPPGTTLLAAAQRVGIDIQATCGGIGICGSCRVRLVSGMVSEPDFVEQAELGPDGIAAGYRLACQTRLRSDVRLEVPADSLTASQRLQLEAVETGVELDPLVVAREIVLEPPTLMDVRSDASRVRQALRGETGGPVSFGAAVLAELPQVLRYEEWQVRVALREAAGRRRVVAVLPRGTRLLGFAVDIGTTKVAMYLLDLESGETLGALGALNPQISCGEDVISRLAWADQTEAGARLLQQRIVECLRDGLVELCGRVDVRPNQIVDAVVVGNTAMHHLFAGLPTRQLGVSPYIAAVTDSLAISARELGLPFAPDAEVHLPPNIAGFVGADHVAMLLAADFHQLSGTVLALDIGTNTEMSLLHGGRLVSCSCPSGPAFEGAHLTAGMRAAPGAIEAVRITGDRILVRTIDDRPAVGICGSGIVDAIAEMLSAGMLDERGNVRKDHPLIDEGTLVLAPAPADGSRRAIAVHRGDVMEIQLAKATIQSGIETLLAHLRLVPEAIENVIIAGAFGSYLDIRSAIRIGMLPTLPRERFRQVGNAAGAGARQMLLSRERRRIAEALALRSEYLELSTQPEYTQRYLRALWL